MEKPVSVRTLRLVLGDQLNENHSWFQEIDPSVLYVLMEVRSETDYVRHHVQKVAAFFLAMRAFAKRLRELGHRVEYIYLDDPHNQPSIPTNLERLVQNYQAQEVEYQLPDEYRLDLVLKNWASQTSFPVRGVDSEHFLTPRDGVARHFQGKKTYLMESFYRAMRQRHNLLMEGTEPWGGRWNFDAENRKKYDGAVPVPKMPDFAHPMGEIVALLERCGVATMGQSRETLPYPITRREALALLDYFATEALPFFGTYEDALDQRHRVLFHSRLSFALNIKLISPLEVVQRCIAEYQKRPGSITLPQIEGFVRQIIGWREYMRGIYWAQMPDYAHLNFFGHKAALPSWFWTGKTRMNCLHRCLSQSLEDAWAHHIQRLMVIGNFALLLGVHPDEVDLWYLGVYVDALDWVEITNTRGMSQYADGGIVGSKPYVSSANYIDKMSNYCGSCAYDRKKKYGDKACPFNALYWDFYVRHEDKLGKNPRIGMVYPTWRKMKPEEQEKILGYAAWVKQHAEDL